MRERIQKAKEYLTRVFSNSEFENPKKVSEILREEKISRPLSSRKTSIELRPCYEACLLNSDQEKHLFKQMNYFKYKAKILLQKEKISIKRLEKIENLIDEAKKVRNQIAESNFRLVAQLLRQNINYYKKNSLVDSLLSDAYYDVLKAVDYFDWTRGHKFSTYATWVIKKNFFRDSKEKQKTSDRFLCLQNSNIHETIKAKDSGYEKESEYEGQKQLVQSLLVLLKHGNCSNNQKRQVFILENYFGLNGKESQTLDEISQKLHITKERVRQLKLKSLEWLKEKVKEMNLNYESGIERISG
jgi:RNA polymerase sigma factor (sigma-70 family)